MTAFRTTREVVTGSLCIGYKITVPAGATVIAMPYNAGLKTPGYAVPNPRPYGASDWDAIHYWFWVPADAVEEVHR